MITRRKHGQKQKKGKNIFMTKPGDSLASKGTCITAEMRKDRTPLEAMKRRAQEAEGELSILKGIETNRVKEAQARCDYLQKELDRVKKENNNLFTRIAELIEANEKEVKNLKWIKDHDYIFLIDENKKLHKDLGELKEDNRKLAEQINDKLDQLRRAGF